MPVSVVVVVMVLSPLPLLLVARTRVGYVVDLELKQNVSPSLVHLFNFAFVEMTKWEATVFEDSLANFVHF